ncbi:putative nuclease HARBI1 [Tanacetum coccineum]
MQMDPFSCYQAKVEDGLAGLNCPLRVTCLLYDDQIRSKLWNDSKLNFEMADVGAIRMATSNATSRKENWTGQSVLTLCNFLIQHQNNNGRNKAYSWSHLQPEYEKIYNRKFNRKQALKSKYDSMRKQYTLWKDLKHGKTGLGWNASTGALACSNDWWDRKIKKNPNVSGFRTKQPSKELQEAWEQLFGGLLAGGSVVVGLGMDQDTSSEIPNVNLENAEIPNVNHENVEILNVNLKNVAIDIDDDTEPIQVNMINMDIQRRNQKRKHGCAHFLMDSMYSCDLVSAYYYKYMHKEPCMTSSQTGEAWMKEVLNGVSNRDVSERFQRSGETISRAFHEILEATTGRSKGFYGLTGDDKPRDPTFFNQHHIKSLMIKDICRTSRKGIPTFNVMAVCDFDLCFTFISVGWEGSTHDTRVFLLAINNRSMNFPKPPEGKYHLVDKGYPDRKGYLVPYPKTRYHKSQFENEPPKNMKEAFNRSHSSLRSSIEISFGILKKRWKILGEMPKYSVETQHDIIIAAFALHNYIRNNDKEDKVFTTFEQHPDYMGCDELRDVRGSVTNNDNMYSGTSNEMKQIRDDIATSIWNARRR